MITWPYAPHDMVHPPNPVRACSRRPPLLGCLRSPGYTYRPRPLGTCTCPGVRTKARCNLRRPIRRVHVPPFWLVRYMRPQPAPPPPRLGTCTQSQVAFHVFSRANGARSPCPRVLSLAGGATRFFAGAPRTPQGLQHDKCWTQGIRLILASRSRAFRIRGLRARHGPAIPQDVPCGRSPMEVRLPSSVGAGGWVSVAQWPTRPAVFCSERMRETDSVCVCDAQEEVLGTISLPGGSWPSIVYLIWIGLGYMIHVTCVGLPCTKGR